MNSTARIRLTSQQQADMTKLRIVPKLSAMKPGPDRLSGKSACIVFDDNDFEGFTKMMREFIEPSCTLKALRMSEIYNTIPGMEADILVIMSPRKLNGNFPDFQKALSLFRQRNPDAFIALNNLHSPAAEETAKMDSLKGIVDHVEHGFAYFPQLLQVSAMMHHARA